jgi:hypothetical protein
VWRSNIIPAGAQCMSPRCDDAIPCWNDAA